jgi:hypothetical protein
MVALAYSCLTAGACSHMAMNTEMSRTLDKYGLNVSLWFPACDPRTAADTHPNSTDYGCVKGDFNDPAVMAAAKTDWQQVFASMPRVDTLFVNAGDPGGQSPDDLLMLTQVARTILHQFHPHASVWICPQDWKPVDYQRWLEHISKPITREWLDGIIYGTHLFSASRRADAL